MAGGPGRKACESTRDTREPPTGRQPNSAKEMAPAWLALLLTLAYLTIALMG
jgi:hypothetical protein